MVFFRSQNLRSNEPVLVGRSKNKISLVKLNLPDVKCCECVPNRIRIRDMSKFYSWADMELSNEQVERT